VEDINNIADSIKNPFELKQGKKVEIPAGVEFIRMNAPSIFTELKEPVYGKIEYVDYDKIQIRATEDTKDVKKSELIGVKRKDAKLFLDNE